VRCTLHASAAGTVDAYLADLHRRPAQRPGDRHALALAANDSRRALAALERRRPRGRAAELAAARAAASRTLSALVGAHLPLVLLIARRIHERRGRALGLELDDLVQDGNLGLIRAAEGFDPERGTAFSTYATRFIVGSIARAIANKARLVRVPVHVLATRARMEREGASDEQIAEVLDGAVVGGPSVVLEEDSLPAETPPADELLDARRRAERVRGLVATLLEPREARILRARFEGDSTLAQAGAGEGLCGERARQLEVSALGKLRAALPALDG